MLWVLKNLQTLSSQYQEIYVKAVLDNLNKMLKSKEEKIFWKANVSELLFEGFKDGFLSIMSSLPDFNDKFGFFYKVSISKMKKERSFIEILFFPLCHLFTFYIYYSFLV